MKNKNTIEVLTKAVENVGLRRTEAKIIGEMFVEFFETEKMLDLCIATWFHPLVSNRRNILIDSIVMYTPLNKKLDFVKENNILITTTFKKYHKIAEQRNGLVHRRTDGKRPGRTITETKKLKFVEDCRQIREDILNKTEEYISQLEKEYQRLFSIVPNSLPEIIKTNKKVQVKEKK